MCPSVGRHAGSLRSGCVYVAILRASNEWDTLKVLLVKKQDKASYIYTCEVITLAERGYRKLRPVEDDIIF